MRIKIDVSKTVEQNATIYFDKAKVYKKKMEGAKDAVSRAKTQLAKYLKEEEKEKQRLAEEAKQKSSVKKEWYHKFRWFITSEGFLVIGGRDATSNEIVVKKHAESGDLVFHTDMAGSPFFVIKKGTGKGEIGAASISETADATTSLSRAWKLGLGESSVFYVQPEQLSKTPQSGEFVPKGAFIARGKSNYIPNKINFAVGVRKETGEFMGGPYEAVAANCEKAIIVEQGSSKSSECAKLIKKELGFTDTDEIVRVLPSGGCKLRLRKKR